ncbi:MAG: hypothetical protein AAGA56_21230 [Myxococcota bacterium]
MRLSLAAGSLVVVLSTGSALAQTAGGGGGAVGPDPAAPADPVATLVLELDRRDGELTELMTASCTEACRALESMRRAVERICELAPATSTCDNARQRVADAEVRLRARCPTCGLDDDELEAATQTAERAPAAAPVGTIESSEGGCASCSAARSQPGRIGTWWAVLVAVVAGASRRRMSPRRRT